MLLGEQFGGSSTVLLKSTTPIGVLIYYRRMSAVFDA
jgi:hypothetical protein